MKKYVFICIYKITHLSSKRSKKAPACTASLYRRKYENQTQTVTPPLPHGQPQARNGTAGDVDQRGGLLSLPGCNGPFELRKLDPEQTWSGK